MEISDDGFIDFIDSIPNLRGLLSFYADQTLCAIKRSSRDGPMAENPHSCESGGEGVFHPDVRGNLWDCQT